ncbi:unnamed protein product [Symbiodinium sp. CCMP2456]|nr:unnamed protein product [Symbiodinium sp. CCMP2456]
MAVEDIFLCLPSKNSRRREVVSAQRLRFSDTQDKGMRQQHNDAIISSAAMLLFGLPLTSAGGRACLHYLLRPGKFVIHPAMKAEAGGPGFWTVLRLFQAVSAPDTGRIHSSFARLSRGCSRTGAFSFAACLGWGAA